MLSASRLWLESVPLRTMLKRFKLAGAHPDMLAGIDPAKAAHNGKALIALEQALSERENTPPSSVGTRRTEQVDLFFWFKGKDTVMPRAEPIHRRPLSVGTEATRGVPLQRLAVAFEPFGPQRQLRRNLGSLFSAAGLHDDFVLPEPEQSEDVGSIVDDLAQKRREHAASSQGLFVRGNRAIDALRTSGVVVVLEDRGTNFLVTMPEKPNELQAKANSQALSKNGDLDDDTKDFLRQRGLMPFDFGMAGSGSALEQLVSAFERLAALYFAHQGTCLRPGIQVCLTLHGASNRVSDDGQLMLAAGAPGTWEDFALGIPQDKWRAMVRLHSEWRSDRPAKLLERQKRLARCAGLLQWHTVKIEGPAGPAIDALISAVVRDEASVKKTVEKYNKELRREILRRRGQMILKETMFTFGKMGMPSGRDTEQPPFYAAPDGRLHVNASLVTTPIALLKILKQHNAKLEADTKLFGTAMSELESVSRHAYIDVNVDPDWRDRDPKCADRTRRFVATLRPMQSTLAQKCKNNSGLSLLVSDHHVVSPSGTALVPWDIDAAGFAQHFLQR